MRLPRILISLTLLVSSTHWESRAATQMTSATATPGTYSTFGSASNTTSVGATSPSIASAIQAAQTSGTTSHPVQMAQNSQLPTVLGQAASSAIGQIGNNKPQKQPGTHDVQNRKGDPKSGYRTAYDCAGQPGAVAYSPNDAANGKNCYKLETAPGEKYPSATKPVGDHNNMVDDPHVANGLSGKLDQKYIDQQMQAGHKFDVIYDNQGNLINLDESDKSGLVNEWGFDKKSNAELDKTRLEGGLYAERLNPANEALLNKKLQLQPGDLEYRLNTDDNPNIFVVRTGPGSESALTGDAWSINGKVGDGDRQQVIYDNNGNGVRMTMKGINGVGFENQVVFKDASEPAATAYTVYQGDNEFTVTPVTGKSNTFTIQLDKSTQDELGTGENVYIPNSDNNDNVGLGLDENGTVHMLTYNKDGVVESDKVYVNGRVQWQETTTTITDPQTGKDTTYILEPSKSTRAPLYSKLGDPNPGNLYDTNGNLVTGTVVIGTPQTGTQTIQKLNGLTVSTTQTDAAGNQKVNGIYTKLTLDNSVFTPPTTPNSSCPTCLQDTSKPPRLIQPDGTRYSGVFTDQGSQGPVKLKYENGKFTVIQKLETATPAITSPSSNATKSTASPIQACSGALDAQRRPLPLGCSIPK